MNLLKKKKIGKLTLKNLKVQESMSEETLCFSADLYDNGKLVAHISNRGQGGSTDVHPPKGLPHSEIEKYCNLDTDCEIFELAEEMNIVNKKQSQAFVIKKDGKIYLQKIKFSFAKMKKMEGYETWLTKQVSKLKADEYEILNTNM